MKATQPSDTSGGSDAAERARTAHKPYEQTEADKRYSTLLNAIGERLGDRRLIIELDETVTQRFLELEERVLDQLVVGFHDPDCAAPAVSWRRTAQTDFDPILEYDAHRLHVEKLVSGSEEGRSALKELRELERQQAEKYLADTAS